MAAAPVAVDNVRTNLQVAALKSRPTLVLLLLPRYQNGCPDGPCANPAAESQSTELARASATHNLHDPMSAA